MRLRAIFYGFINHIEGDTAWARFQNPVTKDEFEGELELKKIEPKTERAFVMEGAYFRMTLRRKITFKFHKHRMSKRRWRKLCSRIGREVDRRLG